jgi:NAD(P)-dependent dehydrogenase (short-subunit alcohol dehydrogenase family)
VVVGYGEPLAEAIAARLVDAGFHVRQIVAAAEARALGHGAFAADLTTDATVKQLHQTLTGREGVVVGGLINLLSLRSTADDSSPSNTSTTSPTVNITATFRVVREFLPDLIAASEEGGGWVVNVTALDGMFGCDTDRETLLDFAASGSLGLFKSLQREQPRLSVKNVDVARELLDVRDPAAVDALAERLVDEFRCVDTQLEIGLTTSQRWRLSVRESDFTLVERTPLELSSESVVLVTGGAYGVTADVARRLAKTTRARLVLVGRSPLPERESPATAELDAAGLRKHLIEQARASGQRITPAEIERGLQRALRNRQILATIDEITASRSQVEYHAVDVRDAQRFGNLINDLYARLGRIDGVVHGAGVIEDKLIADKTPESFSRVFGTKVESALVLCQQLRPESLKFLAFFSSVSGRLGNLGQADYAAANEVLNKCAAATATGRWFDGRPWNGRAVAINWGPWDAGMISDELRKLYAARSIGLIPLDEGVDAFMNELQFAGPAEVVLASWPASMVDALQGGFLKA